MSKKTSNFKTYLTFEYKTDDGKVWRRGESKGKKVTLTEDQHRILNDQKQNSGIEYVEVPDLKKIEKAVADATVGFNKAQSAHEQAVTKEESTRKKAEADNATPAAKSAHDAAVKALDNASVKLSEATMVKEEAVKVLTKAKGE